MATRRGFLAGSIAFVLWPVSGGGMGGRSWGAAGVGPVQVFPHITKHPRIWGGQPCVDDTTVRVLDVVRLHFRGVSHAEIPVRLGLASRAAFYAAMAYYYDHQDEIEPFFTPPEARAARAERERVAGARA